MSTTGLDGNNHSILGKILLSEFLIGTETPADSLPLKIRTFVDIKNLHSAWVADVASLCSSCVRTTCVYLHVFQFFPQYIYFWPHVVETALDKTVGREVTLHV